MNVVIKAEPCRDIKFQEISSEVERLITDSGLGITFSDNLPLRYLIIDNEEIWYSELSFLGLSKEIDVSKARTILHFHDQKMAMKLIEADELLVL